MPEANSAACEVRLGDGGRYVVVASFERHRRDRARTVELVQRTEAKLLSLEQRVRAGQLVDAVKIARAAQRILSASKVARLFDVEVGEGSFVYHYDEDALDYEDLLAGRYVLTTSLGTDQADTAQVILAYRQLAHVEARFRVLKDFLHLRPVFHWSETRVRGHIAICVVAAVIEALMAVDLRAADVRDPDLDDQHLTPARALRELERIRAVTLAAGERRVRVVTGRNAVQAQALAAFGVDTSTWSRPRVA